MTRKLTLKQHKFVMAYLECGNATEAARVAGYKGGPVSLAAQGYQMLNNTKIAAEIAAARAKIAEKTEITLERMTANLSSIAFSESEESKDRIAASRELNRMYGLYVEDNKQRTPAIFNIGYEYVEEGDNER